MLFITYIILLLSQAARLAPALHVLTAIGQVNGRWRILIPYRIETHDLLTLVCVIVLH